MKNAINFVPSTTTFAAVVLVAVGLGNQLGSAAAAPEPFAWPASLAPMGHGYPKAGDACRRLGESPATSNYLDHMAILVGCPGSGDSASVRAILRNQSGRIVGEVDGVTLISIPMEGKSKGGTMGDALGHKGGGAKAKGADFNTTGTLPCARYAGQPTSMCRFGVVRNSDRSAIVTVFWPGGGRRAIFFGADGKVTGAGTSAANRSAPGKITTRKNADLNLISIGDERYEIVDAILYGG